MNRLLVGRSPVPVALPYSQAGVLGCGLIGISWAGLFLASGRDVYAWDPSESARQQLPSVVQPILEQVAQSGLFRGVPAGRLHVVSDVEDLARRVSFIQENAPEDASLKRQLYARIEAVAPADLVIASSTSSLVWSDLSAGLRVPGRLVTAHPFNPPHLMPLVEVFGPDSARLVDVSQFYLSLGRVPVVMKKEAIGHIANRLASALWREAVNIVAEGIADVAEVDKALVNGPGLRWSVIGAHMAYHLGGGPGGIEHYLKHLGPSQERRWASLGTPSLTPEVMAQLVAGVAAEANGRTITELERARDEALIATLQSRRNSQRP